MIDLLITLLYTVGLVAGISVLTAGFHITKETYAKHFKK